MVGFYRALGFTGIVAMSWAIDQNVLVGRGYMNRRYTMPGKAGWFFRLHPTNQDRFLTILKWKKCSVVKFSISITINSYPNFDTVWLRRYVQPEGHRFRPGRLLCGKLSVCDHRRGRLVPVA